MRRTYADYMCHPSVSVLHGDPQLHSAWVLWPGVPISGVSTEVPGDSKLPEQVWVLRVVSGGLFCNQGCDPHLAQNQPQADVAMEAGCLFSVPGRVLGICHLLALC